MARHSTTPADTETRAVEAMMRASRVVTAIAAHALDSIDTQVSVPGLRTLVILDGRGPLNLSAVAVALGVQPSSASRTCERLVAAGLVDRQDDPADRRHVSLRLTQRGKEFVADLMRGRKQVFEQVISTMPTRTQASLANGLESFLASVERIATDQQASDGGLFVPRGI